MDSQRVSLEAAITTTRVDSATYTSQLPLDHCYGDTAHGGILVSTILFAVQHHYRTTLRDLEQPDTFDLQLVFLRPATAGTISLKIEGLRVGVTSSTNRVTVSQNGKDRVTAFTSNINMQRESGFSAVTGYSLVPRPMAAHIAGLADGTNSNWIEWTFPWHPLSHLKAATHFRFFYPADGGPDPSIVDMWLTPSRPDAAFTANTLGSVADIWHRMVENYRTDAEWSTKNLVAQAKQNVSPSKTTIGLGSQPPYGYPTLSLNLEIKKALPPQGVKWLFVRARAKHIMNGRMDAEVTILNENHELVALSYQVGFIVDLNGLTKAKAGQRDGKL